jgi:carboxyl-terminal processing protease
MSSKQNDNFRQIMPFWLISTLFAGVALGLIFSYVPRIVKPSRSVSSEFLSDSASSSNFETDLLTQVYKYLETTYIGEIPDKKEIEYGMVKGLIESLDDEYTNFLTPQEAKAYHDSLVEDFDGIGVTLSYNGEYTYVETVLRDLPAFKNGILPGDIILAVDDEDVSGELPQIVAGKIRGERGTKVKLKIFRENAGSLGETIDFIITRDSVTVENIMWHEKDGGIVVIDILQFNANDLDEFKKNWDTVVTQITSLDKVNGIIVDLRNNPGGLVSGVSYVLEEFLNSGDIIFGEKTKNQQKSVYKDNRNGKFEAIELVVLVNEGSASASEIFAGAIQDNNRGTIVGKPTVGKGVEQLLVDFEDGSVLFLVFQEWFTPSGRVVNKENPIMPDIEVEYTREDFENGIDPQMAKAMELLRS